MTRPARSRVRHGMASCTRYGCTRPECRAAYNRNRQQLNADRARGITATVDAQQAADWARHLALNGMGAQDIAARSGVHEKTVQGLLSARRDVIYRDTADAILGIPTPPPHYEPAADGLVDAVGARRRLRALTTIGYTLPVLADQIGVTPETVGAIRQKRRRYVRISVHRPIAAAYEQLQHDDPAHHGASPSGITRARRWAGKQGWAGPLWWEDMGGIDDPGTPESEDALRPEPRFRVLASEGLWLERQGYTREQAAARLGVTKGNLQASISRARKQGHLQLEEAA